MQVEGGDCTFGTLLEQACEWRLTRATGTYSHMASTQPNLRTALLLGFTGVGVLGRTIILVELDRSRRFSFALISRGRGMLAYSGL